MHIGCTEQEEEHPKLSAYEILVNSTLIKDESLDESQTSIISVNTSTTSGSSSTENLNKRKIHDTWLIHA